MTDQTITGTRESTGSGRHPGSDEQKEWAREEAEYIREELRNRGESFFNEQKTAMASVMDGIASALDKSAPSLEEEGQPNTARYTRQAAESLHRLSANLRERDLDSVRRQVSEMGRRQPGLLVGGAVALGFIASRFLRSSSEHSAEDYPGEEKIRLSEEELIIGTQSGFRSGESAPSPSGGAESSSTILTGREAREAEKEIPT